MTKLAYTAILLAIATATASAQTPTPRQGGAPAHTLSAIPGDSVTVTHWYKQNVYDPSNNKVGEIMDVLIDRGGKASALIIGVGGFLGAGREGCRRAVRRGPGHDQRQQQVLSRDERYQGRAQERQGIQVRSQRDDVDA